MKIFIKLLFLYFLFLTGFLCYGGSFSSYPGKIAYGGGLANQNDYFNDKVVYIFSGQKWNKLQDEVKVKFDSFGYSAQEVVTDQNDYLKVQLIYAPTQQWNELQWAIAGNRFENNPEQTEAFFKVFGLNKLKMGKYYVGFADEVSYPSASYYMNIVKGIKEVDIKKLKPNFGLFKTGHLITMDDVLGNNVQKFVDMGAIIHPYFAQNKEFIKSIQDIKKQKTIRNKIALSPHQIIYKMLSSEPIGGGGGGGGSMMHQKTGNSSELAKRVMTQTIEKWKKSLQGKHFSDDNPALWIIAPSK